MSIQMAVMILLQFVLSIVGFGLGLFALIIGIRWLIDRTTS